MKHRTITDAYTTVLEMNLGPAGAGIQPVGKPVVMSIDLPADGVETEFSQENEEDQGEIDLACASLHKLAEYAPKLLEIVRNKPGLDGWVSSKIALAADYVSEVYHRLDYAEKSSTCAQCNTTHTGTCGETTPSTGTAMYVSGYANA
jgi:hypothetical protein